MSKLWAVGRGFWTATVLLFVLVPFTLVVTDVASPVVGERLGIPLCYGAGAVGYVTLLYRSCWREANQHPERYLAFALGVCSSNSLGSLVSVGQAIALHLPVGAWWTELAYDVVPLPLFVGLLVLAYRRGVEWKDRDPTPSPQDPP